MLFSPRFITSLLCPLVLAGVALSTLASESVLLNSSYDPMAGLPRALQATLKHNPAVKGQNTQILIQQDAIDAAKAGRYPSMAGSLSSHDESASYLELDQPLWAFGKISSAIKVEEIGLDVQQQGLLQVQRQLMEQTATLYTQLQSARLKISVAKENYNEHKKLSERISRRQIGQLASKADVNLAQSRLLSASTDLLSYQSEQQSLLNDLYTLTRVKVDTEAEIDPLLLVLPDINELKKLTLQDNAEITHAAEQINLARAQLKQQQSIIYPTISLNVRQYLLDYYDNDTLVGVVVQGSLDGMGLGAYNQVQGAEKNIIAAQFEFDSVHNEVDREMENLLVNLSLLKALRKSQLLSVEALENTMSSFLRQYEVNRKTWVEVLNQLRELTTMRYSLIATDQQYMALSLKLSIMAGRLDKLAGVK